MLLLAKMAARAHQQAPCPEIPYHPEIPSLALAKGEGMNLQQCSETCSLSFKLLLTFSTLNLEPTTLDKLFHDYIVH